MVEAALPTPFAIVTARAAGREEAKFFHTIPEARQFAAELAAARNAMLVDMTGATEGGAD
ncbi:MAG: hypothetical protein C0486_01465 [Erythrobacter sp.]|nr:hypothetical protein [Erythrobacter sp.]MBA4080307.1 hypothetical protein [Erythrobacter sp.]